ncbi:DUF6191 domain-containing protein [Nakamurella sp. GG22]
MGELGALFNPGMRHELEERQAKAARREEEGNAKDGDLRIDLESGVAVINVSGGEDSASSSETDNATSEDGQPAVSDTDSSDTDGSDTDGSRTREAAVSGAAEEPAASRPAANKSPSRSARPVKTARGSATPEKPALQPRGKRGATAAR